MLPARLVAVTAEPVPDEQLMLRYRDGDAAAFEELYGRHKGGVFRYVLRQVGLRSAAEEVFQEIWMNIVSARARYRVEARFTTFLYHVAHNCVIDHFRRKTPLHLISLDDDPDEAIQVAGPGSGPTRTRGRAAPVRCETAECAGVAAAGAARSLPAARGGRVDPWKRLPP